MLLEGKYELKGDALPMMYKAQSWFVNHLNALKNPAHLPEPTPPVELVEQIPETKTSIRKKK
jgi:hypothetical protein